MSTHQPDFTLRLATTDDDLFAAQRLRYDVFVSELGGDGAMVDHENRLEVDRYDPFFDHLLLLIKAEATRFWRKLSAFTGSCATIKCPRSGSFIPKANMT